MLVLTVYAVQVQGSSAAEVSGARLSGQLNRSWTSVAALGRRGHVPAEKLGGNLVVVDELTPPRDHRHPIPGSTSRSAA